MNVGFAGTPAFAATMLAALLDAGFAAPLVLTQPDRPRGRGLRKEASSVKRLALERGLRVEQPASLAGPQARAMLEASLLDVLVVAAYGLLLPQSVLDVPRHGCINVHASLLPRWRGAAPIQRAILAGDDVTGVTIMQMDAGLDTGPIIERTSVPIDARESAGTLEAKLAQAGARDIVSVLRKLATGDPVARSPQPRAGITVAPKIQSIEAAIDWSGPAASIDRQIRAFDPQPGAYSSLDGERIKLWRAEPALDAVVAPAGSVLEADPAGIVVACGHGTLRLAELQPAGGRRMSAAAFLAGRRLARGARFGADAEAAG